MSERLSVKESSMGLTALVGVALLSGMAAAQTPICNLQDYKSVEGIKAQATC
jgi:hypothetical protein